MPAPLSPMKVIVEMMKAGFRPLEPYTYANSNWKCRHDLCGEEVTVRYSNIRLGRGCGVCAGRYLEESEARETMMNAGLTPLEPFPGAGKPWRCEHACGATVSPRLNNIKNGQGGCLECSHKHLASEKRLDEDHAVRTMIEAGMKPLEPYPGTNRVPWKSLHVECGSIVSPSYGTIKRGRKGCTHCALMCPRDCQCTVRIGRAA